MVTLLVHLLYSSTLLSKARFLLRGKQGQLDSPQVGEYPKKITIQYTNRQAYQKHIFPPNNDQIADEIALDSRLLAETHTSWFASLRYLLNTSYWTLSKQYQNSSKKPLVCQGRAAALLEDNPILLPKLFGEGSLHPEHSWSVGRKQTHLSPRRNNHKNRQSQISADDSGSFAQVTALCLANQKRVNDTLSSCCIYGPKIIPKRPFLWIPQCWLRTEEDIDESPLLHVPGDMHLMNIINTIG